MLDMYKQCRHMRYLIDKPLPRFQQETPLPLWNLISCHLSVSLTSYRYLFHNVILFYNITVALQLFPSVTFSINSTLTLLWQHALSAEYSAG